MEGSKFLFLELELLFHLGMRLYLPVIMVMGVLSATGIDPGIEVTSPSMVLPHKHKENRETRTSTLLFSSTS